MVGAGWGGVCVRGEGWGGNLTLWNASVNVQSHMPGELFKGQSSVRVCECVCANLRKLLVCLLCNFCIFNNCSLSFKI